MPGWATGGSTVDASPPTINILGDKVALGPLGVAHADALARWHNDYAVMRNWAFLPGPRTAEETRRWFEPGQFLTQPENVAFAVYETASWDLAGFAGLIHVDHVDGTAEFFVMIGEARHRGQGYGTEATRLVLDHAFTALGLANVILRVYQYNLAGIRAYEKAGFRRIGVRRKSKRMGGKAWDTVLMEAVADEFESPVLGRVLVADQPRGG
jgi:RimJ/RimL family protein N-acetyltransferase